MIGLIAMTYDNYIQYITIKSGLTAIILIKVLHKLNSNTQNLVNALNLITTNLNKLP